MSLYDKIQSEVKDAMKAGDTVKRDTLRMVLAAIKNKAIQAGAERTGVPDEVVTDVLLSSVKSRTDSAEQYAAADRPELAANERAEIVIIQSYLPKQLGEDETQALVAKTIAEVGAESKKDLGKVMKAILATHKGQVDGKLIQRFAGELLG